MLPGRIAERLKRDPGLIADSLADCTVMFADLTDFTRLAEQMPARDMLEMLNELFSWFDNLADSYGLDKIKTIGDAYMVAGGLQADGAPYTEAIARMALDIRDGIAERKTPRGDLLGMHIGIGTGPAAAGVIGVRKFIYDLWGNTVNIASRLTTEATTGGILVDVATYRRLRDCVSVRGPGALTVKGNRVITAYRLLGPLKS